MSTVTTTYLGPIIAALIAGAVAFLASVLTKELKTSEFRQAWIDQLRNDLADLASLALVTDDAMAYRVNEGTFGELPGYIDQNHEKFAKIMACAMRVEMRLNPDEHKVLLHLVRQVGTSTKTFRGDTTASANAAGKLLTESQLVLKREWLRVKRGENVFHYTKWVSFWVLIISVAALALAGSAMLLQVVKSAA